MGCPEIARGGLVFLPGHLFLENAKRKKAVADRKAPLVWNRAVISKPSIDGIPFTFSIGRNPSESRGNLVTVQ